MSFFRHKDDAGPGPVTAGQAGHTRFGTALDQVINANPNEDLQKWLLIPTDWIDTGGPDEWADKWAELCWGTWVEVTPGTEYPGPEVIGRTKLELAQYAERFGGFDPKQPFEITTFLYLWDPRKYAIPVHVWVDDRPGLTIEQATADEDAIEPPVVEDFEFAHLGVGRKTTSHGVLDPQPTDLPGTQGVWVTTRYAFAVPGRQAIVTVKATETDLARMSAAAADIDEFVASITLAYDDGRPFTVNGAGSVPSSD